MEAALLNDLPGSPQPGGVTHPVLSDALVQQAGVTPHRPTGDLQDPPDLLQSNVSNDITFKTFLAEIVALAR